MKTTEPAIQLKKVNIIRQILQNGAIYLEVYCPKCNKKHLLKVKGGRLCNVGCHCGAVIFPSPMDLDGSGKAIWGRVP